MIGTEALATQGKLLGLKLALTVAVAAPVIVALEDGKLPVTGGEQAKPGAGKPGAPGERSADALGQTDRLGLERYFAYRSTETGAGSEAHVNLATGNLVWQRVPITNPGRGLNTFVTLTYNSAEPPGAGPLPPVPTVPGAPDPGDLVPGVPDPTAIAPGLLHPGPVGRGFSLGISSLTRVNEPLDLRGLPLTIGLTDPDGTRHLFDSEQGERLGKVFKAPPGVQLHLRRFSDSDPVRAWAATRPDGVTHYFDRLGYQTRVQDRNGNVLRFDYEPVSADGLAEVLGPLLPVDVREAIGKPACAVHGALTGLAGPLQATDELLCRERLVRVSDAAGQAPENAPGRALEIRYRSKAEDLAAGSLDFGIKQITDHAGRVTSFAYDPLGHLTRITEAAGTEQERRFELEYELLPGGVEANPLALADPFELVAVRDPRDNRTRFVYGESAERRVEGLHTRTPGLIEFNYQPPEGGRQRTEVSDPLGHEAAYVLDARARPIEVTDPLGTFDVLRWDDQLNEVVATARAAGDPGAEAKVEMTYDQNGLLDSRTEHPDANRSHTTRLTYEHSPGNELSELGLDEGLGFVSDLKEIQRPAGNATAFSLDERGNVTARTDPLGNTATTTYDEHGQITAERDEVGNLTRYADHDPNGLPRIRIDPRDNHRERSRDDPDRRRWLYCYDDVGNLTQATDPRGAATLVPCPLPGDVDASFTTKLDYDALDRLVRERVPRLSAQDSFLTRLYEYDPNDNPTASTDGNGERSERTYTAMDRLAEHRTPPVPHAGEEEEDEASELTRYGYDAAENLIEVISPKGTATPDVAGDFSTRFLYDDADRLVAESRRSVAEDGTETRLTTSYAYDRRDNLVGVVDPLRNERFGGDPVANAHDPERRRYTFEYDLADRRIAQVEVPGDPEDFALRSEYAYDSNDNLTRELSPRATHEGWDSTRFGTDYFYDARDLLVSVREPADEQDTSDRSRTDYTYRADGRLAKITAPIGIHTSDPTDPRDDDDFETDFDYYSTGELKSRTIPRRVGQYDPDAADLFYLRDEVGDPLEITDARGRSFESSFYDTGELRSTERPSWWAYVPDPRDPDSGLGDPELDLRERTPEERAEAGRRAGEDAPEPELPDADSEGDFGSLEPEEPPPFVPRAGETSFARDQELRLTAITDAAGKRAELARDALGRVGETTQPFDGARVIRNAFAYDRNGNLAERADPDEKATSFTYDQFDRRTEIAAPGIDEPEVTVTTYDANDKVTAVRTPRGDQFTYRFDYDAVDRLERETDPEQEKTAYAYDRNGNRILERSPRGNALDPGDPARANFETSFRFNRKDQLTRLTDGHGSVTDFRYDLNGNQIYVEAPGAKSDPNNETESRRVTRRLFDGRDLLWQQTTGSGSNERTTITEFDGNANLRRVVNPAGAVNYVPGAGETIRDSDSKSATLYRYSPDDLLERVDLPWHDADTRKIHQDFGLDGRGRVSSIDAPEVGDTDKLRTDYTRFDSGWIEEVREPRFGDITLVHSYEYDARGNQTRWRSDGSRPGGESDCRRIRADYYDNSLVSQRRAARLVNNCNDEAEGAVTYDYSYNPNHSLTQLTHRKPGSTEERTIAITRNRAERPTLVNETWDGGKDTVFDYDANGNVELRKVDGRFDSEAPGKYSGGRTTSFTYDALDRETRMQVFDTGSPESARSWTTTYWPSSDRKARVRPSGGRDEYFYADDGRISQSHRYRVDLTKNQGYGYDANGNRTSDERGVHSFNARGQLTGSWHRDPGTREATLRTTSYSLDAAGQILASVHTVSDNPPTTTAYAYTGEQLDEVTVTVSGATVANAEYDHTPFGEVREIANSAEGLTSFIYDGFGRIRSQDAPNRSKQSFFYDGLDRRDQRSEGDSAFDYSYIGLTERLSREKAPGSQRLYEADSDYEPAAQQVQPDDGAQRRFLSYALDAVGSVEDLELQGRVTAGAYRYEPYGAIDTTHPYTELTAEARQNPIRFQGFYEDEGFSTYDMRARPYYPRVGRFLTADHFEQASRDFSLETDPLNQQRYLFGGSNPVDNVETDGHCVWSVRVFFTCLRAIRAVKHNRRARQVATAVGRAVAREFTAPGPGRAQRQAVARVARPILSAAGRVIGAAARVNERADLHQAAVERRFAAFKQQNTVFERTALEVGVGDPRHNWVDAAALLPFGKVVRGLRPLSERLRGALGQTETVERVGSRAELEATLETGLIRGGREGEHFVTSQASRDPLRARQRLALGATPEVRIALEVRRGVFGPLGRVNPANRMPGGGLERTARGRVPARVVHVYPYRRR